MGNAAFFEPLTSMTPLSGTPPCMRKLSKFHPPKRLQKKRLTIFRQSNNYSFCTANIAQLAEHLVVAQGVAGSNPVIRPIFRPDSIGAFFIPCVLRSAFIFLPQRRPSLKGVFLTCGNVHRSILSSPAYLSEKAVHQREHFPHPYAGFPHGLRKTRIPRAFA